LPADVGLAGFKNHRGLENEAVANHPDVRTRAQDLPQSAEEVGAVARKLLHLLGERGVLVIERDVLMLEGRNKPGELAEIAAKLARNKVNIEYAYSATPVHAVTGAMILRVDNPKKAARILKGH